MSFFRPKGFLAKLFGITILLIILATYISPGNALGAEDDDFLLLFLPAIISAIKSGPNYVHVRGSQIRSPNGKPVFLKVATWENPFEGSVSEQTIINFMDYMRKVNLNCILLKGNMWLVTDKRQPHQANINKLHRLIKAAEDRQIYVILNLFDVWSRGRGSNSYNTDPNSHPINVWDWGYRHHAATFIKWVTREFVIYPRVLFELGNEMERNNTNVFKRVAQVHLLPHFYAIAGKDRPIGVSQKQLWDLPVNVLFNHDPNGMPMATERAIITNELAYHTDLWKDSVIRDHTRSQEYFDAFDLAVRQNHAGVAAATIIDINKPIDDVANRVLRRLGGL